MTTKKTTKKRKQVSKSDRQKKKIWIVAGLAVILLALIVVLAMFLIPKESKKIEFEKADRNTVFILEDGKIVSTDIEPFDETLYDKEEFNVYVDDLVATYNKEHGEESLTKKYYTVENNLAKLVLEYANTDIYESVNGVELFSGTVKQAKKAGYTFDCDFAKMVDGKAVKASLADFEKAENIRVAIIKSNTKVVLQGEVCYVSTQNVSKVGEDYVIIQDGCQLLAEEIIINTEFGTEAEGSDESISEDELVSGDGNMIFDFGEEEEEPESQYSEVLTYIIYKISE